MNKRTFIIFIMMIFILGGCFSAGKKDQSSEAGKSTKVNSENVDSEETSAAGEAEAEAGAGAGTGAEVSQGTEGESSEGASQAENQGTSSLSEGEGKKEASATGSETKKSQTPSSNANNGQSSTTPSKEQGTKEVSVTEAQIEQKYKQELLGLQSYYSSKLQGLYQGAIQDLKNNKGSNKEIYSKYFGIGMSLKEESEAKVNQTLYQMEQELKANSFSTDSVNTFRQTYYAQIQTVQTSAFSQIKQELGM